ncbi:MAG: dihydrodipicolinate synthase family protein [Boseongicola sp. SB0662_bin_57]|nr:dihydrodipicolinate synthase family protein [Boseongicola sp. SB0662_bin_57]
MAPIIPLTGISGILVTLFDEEGNIAADRLTPIVDRAIEAGIHALTINGNTSEFYGLTIDEALAMVDAAAATINGRTPLIGGVGRSLPEACTLARASVAAGAAAVMVHQPPDPFVSPRGLKDYVAHVSDAARGIPVLLYLRNDVIGTRAIVDLCETDNVVGVKWATPSPENLAQAMAASPGHIVWICGLAEVRAPQFYAVGARGFTSGLINVWPARSAEIHGALDSGNHDNASNLIDGIRAFEELRAAEMGGTNVSVVKAALALMGEYCGSTRPPSSWPLSKAQESRLRAFLDEHGINSRSVC